MNVDNQPIYERVKTNQLREFFTHPKRDTPCTLGYPLHIRRFHTFILKIRLVNDLVNEPDNKLLAVRSEDIFL